MRKLLYIILYILISVSMSVCCNADKLTEPSFSTKCKQPSGAKYIGKLKPFYRCSTMVDSWLVPGGGILKVPSYLTTAGDFPYQKRPFDREGLFTDEFILVRALGGWDPAWLKRQRYGSETIGGTDIKDYDIAYRDDDGRIKYNWSLLKKRIAPYIRYGYSNLTFVLDNVCWCFPENPQVPKNCGYGQNQPPADVNEWQNFITALCKWLKSTYGNAVVDNWIFRVGTEMNERNRFDGTAEQLQIFYDYSVQAVINQFPNAVIGAYNYCGRLADKDGGGHIELIRHIKNGKNYITGKSGNSYSFTCRSCYCTKVPNRDYRGMIAYFSDEYNTVDDIFGCTFPREIHEFGILENEYGDKTCEPGVYGAAWTFNAIMGFYSEGVTKIQHWMPVEKLPEFYVIRGKYWSYMILDHLLGGELYKLNSPADSSDGTQYEIYAITKDGKIYIMLSAFNASRSIYDSREVSFEVPEDILILSDNLVVKESKLTAETSIYDRIREDLEANELLLSPWVNHNGAIADIFDMGGSSACEYVVKNRPKYQKIFEDSLTLKDFTGTYSKTPAGYKFTVATVNPMIMLIEIKTH